MPNQRRFKRRDADFNNYINSALIYLATHKDRLITTVPSQKHLAQLETLISIPTTGWNSIYPQSQNTAVRTSSITRMKNNLRVQIENTFRAIFSDIPMSSLNQVDRDTLNIRLPSSTHTPALKPAQTPFISISGRAYLSVTINISDTDSFQSQAKPSGVDAIEIQSAFFPDGATLPVNFPRESDFRHLAITGRTSYRHTYTQDHLKGTDYLRARYLNTRKESGNWSQPINFVVS